ncbi:MAG: GNAT family N-acetyltransferase [Alphaproteobacteria bacterium]
MTHDHGIVQPGSDRLEVDIAGGLGIEEIGGLWRTLEHRARPSFFLSWAWIGCWLAEAATPAGLVMVRRRGDVVGLALVGRSRRRRLLPVTGLHLHETGRPDLDGIWIEYNGFLAAPEDARAVTTAVLRHLVANRNGRWSWDELHLNGVDRSTADIAVDLAAGHGLRTGTPTPRACPTIDLAGIRAGGGGCIDAVSRNTRQQIRRSMRLYEETGALRLERAETPAQALIHLDGLKDLHQRHWRDRGRSGAFAAPAFERFHRRLVETALPSGSIDLTRVAAGPRTIGYLYNFVRDGIAYSYQSGFDYDAADPRRKPGLVAHLLAAEAYLAAGLDAYRLMAGDSRYKRSLANGGDDTLCWLTLRRDGPLVRAREMLDAARGMLRRRSLRESQD